MKIDDNSIILLFYIKCLKEEIIEILSERLNEANIHSEKLPDTEYSTYVKYKDNIEMLIDLIKKMK